MNATDVVRRSQKMAKGFAEVLLRDMAADPFARSTSGQGHHAYWLLGHIVYAEAQGLDRYLLNKPNRYEKWAKLFAMGTTPGTESADGPSYEELLLELDAVGSAVLEYVASLSDSDLENPCHAVEGGPAFETTLDCLLGIAMHTAIHTGQLADVRRAAGRKPLFF